jgi:hypothetical protein
MEYNVHQKEVASSWNFFLKSWSTYMTKEKIMNKKAQAIQHILWIKSQIHKRILHPYICRCNNGKPNGTPTSKYCDDGMSYGTTSQNKQRKENKKITCCNKIDRS